MNTVNKDTLNIKAPAKINLTLDVIGRLPNGYHELKMIMQTISIYDELTVSLVPHTTSQALITLNMDKELPDKIPSEKNLVYKAAMLMKKKFNIVMDFNICLNKNIPSAAGLAGGSSDCAATFIAINQLCRLGLSKEELCKLGVTLGADVPYCIRKGTMLSEGIGEILTPITPLATTWLVLIKPNISISTAYVYQNLDIAKLKIHPNTDRMIKAIEENDIFCIASCLCNVLETVTIPKHSIIEDIKTFLKESGASGALMSGSGPTVFGIFTDEKKADIAYRRALNCQQYKGYDILLCHTI